jgi:hypothetical protein
MLRRASNRASTGSRGSSRSRSSSKAGSPATSPRGGSPKGSTRPKPPPMLRKSSSKALLDPSAMAQRSHSRRQSRRAQETRLDQRAAVSNWCCLNLTREEALARLPQKEGAFVIRRSTDYFATLTMVANGKHFHAQIQDTTEGLKLKKATKYQPNLSAMVAYYKIATQTDLPRPLSTW